MQFLEYLFYKYYNFQLRVGNESNAPMMSALEVGLLAEHIFLLMLFHMLILEKL